MENTFTDPEVSENVQNVFEEMDNINSGLRSIDNSNLTEQEKQSLKRNLEQQKLNLIAQANRTFNIVANSLPSDIENIDSANSIIINDILNDSINDSYQATGDIYEKISSLDLKGTLTKLSTQVEPGKLKKYENILKYISDELLKKIQDRVKKTGNNEVIGAYTTFAYNLQDIAKKLKDLLDKGDDSPATKKLINEQLKEIVKQTGILDSKVSKHFYDQFSFGYELNDFRNKMVRTLLKSIYILGMVSLLGGIGYLIAGFIFSETESGCYMFTNNTKYKLSGCNIDKNNCKCGKLVSTSDKKVITSDICNSLSADECNLPYCIGMCKSNSTLIKCENNTGGILFQCTNADIADPNFVYYAYQEYSPWTFLGNLIDFGSKIATGAEKAVEDSLTLFQKIINFITKYLPIFIILFFICYVGVSVLKFYKKNGPSTLIEENIKIPSAKSTKHRK